MLRREPSSLTPLLLPDSGQQVKLVVVDADNPAMDPWIVEQYGDSSLQVSTGRAGGGTHHYYQQPEGELVVGRNKEIGPDEGVETWAYEIDPATGKTVKSAGWGKTQIDVKARRNYVVAPGALHKSGRRYTAAVDVQTITVDWLKELPVFNRDLYEGHVEESRARRAAKEKEIAAAHGARVQAERRRSRSPPAAC